MSSLTEIEYIQQHLVLLRAIVAALGERVTPPWWRTQFLTEVGLRTLSRVFPRTAASSGLNSVSMVARREHDNRIGLGGRYHLFRLPESVERSIAALMSNEIFSKQWITLVSNGRNDLIDSLAKMADQRKVPAAEGPIGLGSSTSITTRAGIEAMAAHYWHSV